MTVRTDQFAKTDANGHRCPRINGLRDMRLAAIMPRRTPHGELSELPHKSEAGGCKYRLLLFAPIPDFRGNSCLHLHLRPAYLAATYRKR